MEKVYSNRQGNILNLLNEFNKNSKLMVSRLDIFFKFTIINLFAGFIILLIYGSLLLSIAKTITSRGEIDLGRILANTLPVLIVLSTLNYVITIIYYYVLYRFTCTSINTTSIYLEISKSFGISNLPVHPEILDSLYKGLKRAVEIIIILILIVTIKYIINLYSIYMLQWITSREVLETLTTYSWYMRPLLLIEALLSIYALYLLLGNLGDIYSLTYASKAFQMYAITAFIWLIYQYLPEVIAAFLSFIGLITSILYLVYLYKLVDELDVKISNIHNRLEEEVKKTLSAQTEVSEYITEERLEI